jgi:hypothetical protein
LPPPCTTRPFSASASPPPAGEAPWSRASLMPLAAAWTRRRPDRRQPPHSGRAPAPPSTSNLGVQVFGHGFTAALHPTPCARSSCSHSPPWPAPPSAFSDRLSRRPRHRAQTPTHARLNEFPPAILERTP